MQATTNNIHLLRTNELKITTNCKDNLLLKRLTQGDCSAFWQLWQRHRDYLYHRCLASMGGNYVDAEDALSQVMLKAWDKLPNYAEKIINLRAWLTRFTYNLCVDIHRRRTKVMVMESFEEIAITETEAVSTESPELAILRHELGWYIRRTVDSLPCRLRTPFTLRYYHQIADRDIAQQLAISPDNVYKRHQQARKILQRHLSRYLSGLDDSLLNAAESFCQKGVDQTDATTKSDSQAGMAMGGVGEMINYQVTATCLETLPSGWYHSPSHPSWG